MKLGEATADNVFSKVESALGTTGTNILQFSTILAVIIVAWTALWQGLITKDKDFGKNIRRIIVAYIVIVSIGLISSTLAKTLFGSNTLSFAKPAIG
ncbi:MAG: hypothetical protein LBN03_01625 [Bifidobacteriaceae bacterium]|nr:hypothetical protein [Bifidobacteriaceae bacterium]